MAGRAIIVDVDRPTDVLLVLLETELDRYRRELPGPVLGIGDDEHVIWCELPLATRETFVEEYERLCSLRERDPLVFELIVQALAEQLEDYRRVLRAQRDQLPDE